MLTIELFKLIPFDSVFATGFVINGLPEQIERQHEYAFMTRSGGLMRWVAVKGLINDWTIYMHWSYQTIEWIEEQGDKLRNDKYIKNLVPCDDEVFALYRK